MKHFLLKTVLLLCALVVGSEAWADTVTFDASSDMGSVSTNGVTSGGDQVIKGGITITSSNGLMGNGTNYRVYQDGTFTITSTVGNITKIEFTCTASGTSNYGPSKLSATGYTYSGTVGTWTGNASSVTLTASAQCRATQIVVTYTPNLSYTITASSNNNTWGTVALSGSVITATPEEGYTYASPAYTVSPANSATVVQNGNNFTVTPTADTNITINFMESPSHTAKFSINGSVSSDTYKEGAPVTFPVVPATLAGKTFMGWSASTITGTQEGAPADLITAATTTMGNDDITYYAVFATSSSTFNWQKLEASEITEGGTYAIITSGGRAFNGTISSGHGQATTSAFSFTTNKVATSAPTGTCEITLEPVKNNNNQIVGYTMYNADKGYLYASKAGSGGLAWHSSEDCYWSCPSSSWKYSKNYSGSYAYLRVYNNTFRTYSSTTNEPIYFAKKITITTYSDYCTSIFPVSVTVSAAGYSTLYYSDCAFVVPDGVEARTYTVDDAGTLSVSWIYDAGEVIPAGQAVVLKANAGNYDFVVTAATGDVDSDSNLRGTDVEATTTGGEKYYQVSLNSSNEAGSVGFYYGAADGAAFTCGAHKAYLATPSAGVKSFYRFDEEATGIDLVEQVESQKNVNFYDLTGRRVAQPTRGVYIVNGKKVMIK